MARGSNVLMDVSQGVTKVWVENPFVMDKQMKRFEISGSVRTTAEVSYF